MSLTKIVSVKTLSMIVIVITAGWFLSEYDVTFGGESQSANTPDQWEQPQDKYSQSDDGSGNVTLTAQYLPDQSSSERIVFEVFLNTHSVNLESVDFSTDVYLEKNGQKYMALNSQISGSGHHRSAVIEFPRVDSPVSMVAENIADINRRVLTWDSF